MEPLFEAVLVEDVLAFTDLLYFKLVATWVTRRNLFLIVERLHANAAHVVLLLLLFVKVFVKDDVRRLFLEQLLNILISELLIDLLLVTD